VNAAAVSAPALQQEGVRTRVTTRRIAFLDWLRAAASLMVVWDHLVARWLHDHGRGWLPLAAEESFLSVPLVITQNLGWLGVVTFFLISGFIISSVSVTETTFAFVLKRVLRIFPPLVAAVLGIVLLAQLDPGTNLEMQGKVTLENVLLNFTLLNYVKVPQVVLVGVAWTLVIEVAFYALMALTARFLRSRHAILTPVLIMLVAAFFLLTGRRFGASYFLLAVTVSYVPLLVLGQLLWLRWTGKIRWLWFVVLSLGCWVLFVQGVSAYQPQFLQPAQSYGPSVALGYALFAFLLSKNSTIRTPSVVRFLAERGYSIYLFHGPVGLVILDHLYGRLPFSVVLLLTFAGVLVVVELVYRLVERPSQRLARILSKSRKHRGAAAPTEAPAPAPAESSA
jgi:peptidoglycan/LPS O-acetylase OafA/YrhL